MSGGPQVFLGATTFLCGCCAARSPASARSTCWYRPAWCARGRRPARSPSALRASLGASSRSPARPCRRPRTSQRVPQASQRPPIGRSDEHSPAPPQPTNSGIREVPTQFVWCRAQWRRQLNPAQKRIRAGPLLLALTRRRVSSLLGRRTCRSTPRQRWGGSNQAGWPGADST